MTIRAHLPAGTHSDLIMPCGASGTMIVGLTVREPSTITEGSDP
jgi:hypothetical protein